MRARTLCSVFACILLVGAQHSIAAPVLEVAVGVMNASGEREWKVRVAPDAALFANGPSGLGKSLGLELAFEANAGSLGDQQKFSGWIDNPGLNPFTNNPTDGVVLDNTKRKLFAALGGSALASDQLVDVLSFESAGTGP